MAHCAAILKKQMAAVENGATAAEEELEAIDGYASVRSLRKGQIIATSIKGLAKQ